MRNNIKHYQNMLHHYFIVSRYNYHINTIVIFFFKTCYYRSTKLVDIQSILSASLENNMNYTKHVFDPNYTS